MNQKKCFLTYLSVAAVADGAAADVDGAAADVDADVDGAAADVDVDVDGAAATAFLAASWYITAAIS
jgi:hypothetical protein